MTRDAGEHRAVDVRVTDEQVIVVLTDGRRVSVPLAFCPTLLRAKPEQREDYEVIGPGEGYLLARVGPAPFDAGDRGREARARDPGRPSPPLA